MTSKSFNIEGTLWTYFIRSANSGAFTLQFEATEAYDMYIRKGETDLPDPANFDVLFKQENSVVLNNYSFDASKGFIVAIRMHHAEDAVLQLIAAEEHFIMLSAAVAAEPAPPMYDLPQPDPVEDEASYMMSDIQYMLLGAVFGIMGTLLYWRFAKAQERLATERREREVNDPNQFVGTKQIGGQPHILYDADEERDDLKKELP